MIRKLMYNNPHDHYEEMLVDDQNGFVELENGIRFNLTKSGHTRLFIPWHRVLGIEEYNPEGFES